MMTSRLKRYALMAAACLAATAAAMAPASAATAGADCYSSGVRTGTVQKFAQKGLFKKSYEGELVQEGVRTKGEAGVTNVWPFSALDPGVANQLDNALLSGKSVTLRYCESYLHNVLSTSTPYTVVEVIQH